MTSMELINNKNQNNSAKKPHKKVDFHTPFWANFKMDIKALKKILIVISVLHLFGLPLLMLSSIIDTCTDSYSQYGFMMLGIGCLAIVLLMGFGIALNSFDYLYTKSKVDMVYSLPLTTKQRFLSDYFAGLFVYVVPYLVSVILTFIMHGLACFGLSEWADYNQTDSITPYLIKFSICGLFIMIMFYTLTVLITCCCGSKFEAIAYNVIANGLIPAVIAVFFLVFFNDLYGIDVDDYLYRYISSSSPLGAVIGVFQQAIYGTTSQLIRWYIVTLLADVVYFFIAYTLYSKRKAEDVSKPFVFKMFYYITMTAITFIIIAIASYIEDEDYIVPMLIFSAIVYFICEVITNRGFKKFGLSVVRYIATVCGVAVICLILNGTNGFGIENKVPVASSISSVTIDYNGIYNENSNYSYYGSTNGEFKVTDKETIEKIIAFHKEVIQNRFKSYYDYTNDRTFDEYEECYDDYYSNSLSDYSSYYDKTIHITYNTNLGGTISREYNVSFEQYLMLKDLSLNKNYINLSAQNFYDSMISNYDTTTNYTYYSSTQDNIENRKYYLEIRSKLSVNSRRYNNLTYSQIVELSNCYKKDLQNNTLDDILTPNDTYCYIDDYVIFDSYTNTIDFLTKNSYIPPTLKAEIQSYSLYNDSSQDCILFAPSDITCAGGEYSTTINVYFSTNGRYISSDSTSTLELLEVAQPYYVTTDKCYIIKFNSKLFVIPSKYTSMAEDVYNNNLSTYKSTNSVSDIQNDTDLLKYDFLSCCEDTYSIWEKHFTNSYPDFETFVEELLYGNVNFFTNGDYDGDISAEDYNTLKTYSEYYWTVYDDITATYDLDTTADVDALVWSLLKSTYYDEGFQTSTANKVI